MNVLIISNLILILILLGIYLYIRNSLFKHLFINVLILDILIYYIFPILISILNVILCITLNFNSLFLGVAFTPLAIPIFKVIFRIIIFIREYTLYNNYENSIYCKLIELLKSMDIYVGKEKITLDLRKSNKGIYCDAYIKVLDIKDKDKQKDELVRKLEETFNNIKFRVIFDVQFK